MRCALLPSLLVLLVLTACPGKHAGQAAGGWKPGEGLPPEWPVKGLSVPADGRIFEGRVSTSDPSGLAVTVFYTADGGWEGQLEAVEKQLATMGYLRMPPAAKGDGVLEHATWCSADGAKLVFISYSDDPQADARLGRSDFFTLLAKQLAEPLKVDSRWPAARSQPSR